MGRNTNPIAASTYDVPVGGTILLNSSTERNIFTLADGKQFSSDYQGQSKSFNRTDGYGKFVDAYKNSAGVSYGVEYKGAQRGLMVGHAYVWGATGGQNYWFPQGSSINYYNDNTYPSIIGSGSDAFVNTPTATIGNYTVALSRFPKSTSSNNSSPSIGVWNTSTKTLEIALCQYGGHVWLDSSSTPTIRAIGSENGSTWYLYTSTNGTTWTKTAISGLASYSNFNNGTYQQPSVIAYNQFVGVVTYNGNAGHSLYASTNGGSTFSNVTGNLPSAPAVIAGWDINSFQTYNSSNTTWLVYTTSNSLYSTDSGTTWNISGGTAVTPATVFCKSYGASNAEIMLVASASGSRYTSYTSDGGRNWSNGTWANPTSGINTYVPTSVAYLSGNWYISLQAASNFKGIYVTKSTNNGSTWGTPVVVTYSNHTAASLVNLLYSFGSHLYQLAFDEQAIYRSSDGSTWTKIFTGKLEHSYPYTSSYNLTDYVVICNQVINKTTLASVETSEMPYGFYDSVGYSTVRFRLNSDLIVAAGTQTKFVNFIYSSGCNTINAVCPQTGFNNYNLGSGSNWNSSQTYQFWRVK